MRPWQQPLWGFSPPVMPPEDCPRMGHMTFVSCSEPSVAPQCPLLQEAVGLVVESLWDTSGFESCLCHVLAAGPWANCLTARSLSLLICKMGMPSSCLVCKVVKKNREDPSIWPILSTQ